MNNEKPGQLLDIVLKIFFNILPRTHFHFFGKGLHYFVPLIIRTVIFSDTMEVHNSIIKI